MYTIVFYDDVSRLMVVKEFPEDQKDRFDFEVRKWSVSVRNENEVFIPISISNEEYSNNTLNIN